MAESKIIAHLDGYYTEGTYDFAGTTAGSHGYIAVTLTKSVSNNYLPFVLWYTGQIAAINGLQLTPIRIVGSTLYVSYYAPDDITAGALVYFYIYIFRYRAQ